MNHFKVSLMGFPQQIGYLFTRKKSRTVLINLGIVLRKLDGLTANLSPTGQGQAKENTQDARAINHALNILLGTQFTKLEEVGDRKEEEMAKIGFSVRSSYKYVKHSRIFFNHLDSFRKI